MESFSDDDLDDLGDDVLTALEKNAIQCTQAQANHQDQLQAYDYAFEDDDFDDAEVIDKQEKQPLPTEKPLPPVPVPTLAGQQRWNQQQQKTTAMPIRWQRPGPSQSLLSTQARPPRPTQFSRAPAGREGTDDQETEKLRARLSELERDLYSARGEATMLRGKFDKMRTDHDAELARMNKASAEQAARQERAVEAARLAQQTAATELEFTRQDVREGARANKKKDGATTPKKNVGFVPDGFDQLEVLPRTRHGGGNGLERTPSKGKRKRPVFDSPGLGLEIDEEMVEQDVVAPPPVVVGHEAGSLPFDFLTLALDHSPLHGQPLTFDLLAGYVFPRDATQSFASIIFQRLPRMGSSDAPYRLLVDFASLLLDLWARCLSEKYYEPIYDLAALLAFTLHLNTAAVAPAIMAVLVHVVQDTCLVVAMPRFHSSDGRLPRHVEEEVHAIDVAQALSLLHLVALGVSADESVRLWKGVQLEWLLVMLSPKQPERELTRVLALLRASVSATSIGPVPDVLVPGTSPHRTPEMVARAVLDRVACHLADPPPWSTAGPGLRLAALQTLLAFAGTPFGALQVAASDAAVPRVVTVLSWALDRLYDMDAAPIEWEVASPTEPVGVDAVDVDAMHVDAMDLHDDPFPAPTATDTPLADPSPVLCRLVAHGVLLLHRIATDKRTAETAGLPARLADSHGAFQRFLLALARLNFVAEEDPVLEAGLDAETLDLAHDLLELTTTPDEADRVAECFVSEVG